ncbi:MAG: FG-GAP-like repeat-containing protein [Myxococcota bacterium]
MRPFLAALAIVGMACNEPTVRSNDDGDSPLDSDDPTGGVSRDGEFCNGVDDDADGLVDEGWPDSDGDGLADCMERDCTVEVAERESIGIDPDCVREPWEPPAQPWDVRVEWHVETGGRGVVTTPMVGNLTDDNKDGLVDDRDVPEIVFTTLSSNELFVLSGDTGALRWSKPNMVGEAGTAIADVDSDGDNEVVSVGRDNSGMIVIVWEADGSMAWQARLASTSPIYSMVAVADLEGDGTVEVIVDKTIYNGKTGEVIVELDVAQYEDVPLRTPIVGDVDQDGEQEIMIAADRFDPRGGLEYRHPTAQFYRSTHNAIANVDDDADGEILMGYANVFETINPDGESLFKVPLLGSNAGPPCVADFDGDGEVEVGLGVGESVAVFELDGALVWQHPSYDATIAHAGCSGYDFDGDGAYELLHADQHTFYIFDGATGEVRYQDARHTSTTHFEYPVVADVDNDGHAEIVLASNTSDDRPGWAGITVFGHAGSGWARSGATWGVHDFAVTNIEGDGSVPRVPVPPWLEHNVFRARPTVDSPALANLQIEITDVCVGTCEGGPVKISWQASNVGGAPVRPGTRVTLYVLDKFEKEPVDVRLIPGIPPGTSLAGEVIFLEPDQLKDGLLLTVDDDGDGKGWVEECHEDDNFAAVEESICP